MLITKMNSLIAFIAELLLICMIKDKIKLNTVNRWKKIISNAKALEKDILLAKKNASYIIRNSYSEIIHPDRRSETINDNEFNVYSQNGEDGILLFILSKIGVHNYSIIEFGGSDGIQCNSANLILNFGWKSLLIEGSQEKVNRGKKYYSENNISDEKLKFVSSFITAENINQLFTNNGFNGEIDILSIDIDGNDYHVWKAINCINPRIVVAEYNAAFGPKRNVTIPYKSDFTLKSIEKSGFYFGASLGALEKLGEEKGYTLIGTDSYGVNSFFIRNDLMNENFTKLNSIQCFHENLKCKSAGGFEKAFDKIKHLDLLEL